MLQATSYTGKLIGNIDFITANWDRKWSEAGDFMIYLPLDEYMRLDNEGMKYVSNVGRPETGVIQKIEYSKDESGAFVTISGYFAEKLLDFGAYRKTQVIGAETSSEVKTAITKCISNSIAGVTVDSVTYKPLESVIINSNSVFPSEADLSIESDTQLGEAIYEVLSDTGYSVVASVSNYPTADSGSVGLELLFKAGNQKTEGENGIFFGKAYNNVDDVSYTLDESAEFCLYEVLQEVEADHYSSFSTSYFPIKFSQKEDGETKYYIGCTYFYKGNQPSNLGACYPKKVLTTSLSSDECDLTVTTTANQKKIRNLMRKKAQLGMLNYYKVESISIDVIQERFTYLEDYDLGDVCVALIDDMEQLYYARIEECNETHKDNIISVEIVMGTPSKQKWRLR